MAVFRNIVGVHCYAGPKLARFLAELDDTITVAKARSSETAHLSVPVAAIDSVKQAAAAHGLSSEFARFFRGRKFAQLIIRS